VIFKQSFAELEEELNHKRETMPVFDGWSASLLESGTNDDTFWDSSLPVLI
jgi:hypothetical protein